jgi:hypothetical protein
MFYDEIGIQKPGDGSMESKESNTYRIWVKETLDSRSMEWFGDLTIIPQENGGTLLAGPFPDQPALRGLIDQLWNLNLTVLSVERVENERGGKNVTLDGTLE